MTTTANIVPPSRKVQVQGETLTVQPFMFFQLEEVGDAFEQVIAASKSLGQEIQADARAKLDAARDQALEAGKSDAEVIAAIEAAMVEAEQSLKEFPIRRLFMKCSKPILHLCRVATERDDAFFRRITIDEGIALAAAVFAVNKEQYGKNVEAALEQVMQALAAAPEKSA